VVHPHSALHPFWVRWVSKTVLTLSLAGAVTGCGAEQRRPPAPQASDLGTEISAFVAQLHPVGGPRGGQIDRAYGMDVGPAGGGPVMGISTVLVGNVAYIGIDTTTTAFAGGGPGPTHAGGPGGGGVNSGMEPTVRSQVRSLFPQIADVYVTTDPELVFRIARLGGDIRAGISLTGRLEEIFTMARQLTPEGDPVPTTLPRRGDHN